jgi:hypothetical protein
VVLFPQQMQLIDRHDSIYTQLCLESKCILIFYYCRRKCVLSRDLVSIDGVRIGSRIYWTLQTHKFGAIANSHILPFLQHATILLSLPCLHRLWPGNIPNAVLHGPGPRWLVSVSQLIRRFYATTYKKGSTPASLAAASGDCL